MLAVFGSHTQRFGAGTPERDFFIGIYFRQLAGQFLNAFTAGIKFQLYRTGLVIGGCPNFGEHPANAGNHFYDPFHNGLSHLPGLKNG
jgi:hypothetical protein